MDELRAVAMERFQSMAWPTPSEEEWRRTDLSGVDLDGWVAPTPRPAPPARGGQPRPPRRAAEDPVAPPAGRIVIEGGRVTAVDLGRPWQAEGVRLLGLEQALVEFADPVQELFHAALQEADNRFIAWHYATWTHGALLYVPAFLEIREPFVIELREGHGNGERRLSAPHVVVLLAEGARASVVQAIEGDGQVLCNAAFDLRVGPAAALRWYESQALGEGSLYFRHARARVDRDASLEHFDASLGSRLVKTRVDCALTGPGSEAYLDGVYFPHGEQHMDIRTVQRHCSPRATSRAFYKGAVKDSSRAVFQGLIDVSPGASGTDAFLTNRNILLNDGARADSIPSLKIGNNDVKCSHGSTVGRIREEELFYLMSRGLPRDEARELLVLGYFDELLAKTPEEFRGTVLPMLHARLRTDPAAP